MKISWSTQCAHTLKLHADAIEFSPDGTVALCGSYELDEKSNTRVGALYVYKQSDEGDDFLMHASSECPGVLDIAWIDSACAVTALSDGSLSLWRVDAQGLRRIDSNLPSKGIMLSVEQAAGKAISSDTNGMIYLWNLGDSSLDLIRSVQAHQAETWCVAWNTLQSHIFFSGADDGNCCVWDERETTKPVFSIRHEAGVCSVRNHPTIRNRISTGSYDDSLRLWDLRMLNTSANPRSLPQPLLTCPIGGGVWRHKWSPDGDWILLAAMHAGFALTGPFAVEQHDTTWSDPPPQVYRYRTDAQLAYGVDWTRYRSDSSDVSWTVGACSFYDNLVDFSRLSISAGS